jgi:hypothetical protein
LLPYFLVEIKGWIADPLHHLPIQSGYLRSGSGVFESPMEGLCVLLPVTFMATVAADVVPLGMVVAAGAGCVGNVKGTLRLPNVAGRSKLSASINIASP